MIRFIELGNQINEWANEFAFYDTCIDKFIDFGNDETFESRADFKFYDYHELYNRCVGLIPSTYKDTIEED